MDNLQNLKLEFDEPRLRMGPAARFLTRVISYCFYSIFIVATATFLLSDVKRLFWLGVFFILFLFDRAVHFGKAEKSLVGVTRFLPRLSRRKGDAGQVSQSINVSKYLTPASLDVLGRAYDRARLVGGNVYLYLLKFLVERPEIAEALLRMDVNLAEFKQKIEKTLQDYRDKAAKDEIFFKVGELAKLAFLQAAAGQSRDINPADLFSVLGLISDKEVERLLNLFSISPTDLEKAMIFSRFKRRFKWLKKLPASLGGFAYRPYKIRHRVMNRAWTSRPTPVLDRFSTDFTDLAREEQLGFLIGHEKEFKRLVDVLSRPAKPNALLVGEPGSGKKSLVAALAFRVVKDEVPESLFDKRVVSLQIGSLVAGAPAEELASRLNKIVEEIIIAGNVILFIPDIHNLVKTAGEKQINAADILMPIISNDAFPVIGATYPKEFKQLVESQTDFANAFETIRVEEISEDEATRLLTYDSLILEQQYKLVISFGAVKEAVELAYKYFRNKLLPSSAEDLLKEALSDVSQKGGKTLTPDDVIRIAERKTNVPIHRAGKEEVEKLLNLEKIIHERLINQEEAVKGVSQALREYRSGLSRAGGPIAAFLFVGPTGVGKTELSKILAKIQFGSERMMLRFDMSEYQDKQSIFRFIGSPDGRIAGSLTEAVIQKPYSLILLDEFEKSHPDILNLFLQVFDDGRLTDSLGRTIDFQNTIIIATSNAHSDLIKQALDAGEFMEGIAEYLKKKLVDFFRPELLNRFSKIIVFKELTPENLKAITQLNLGDLAKTLDEEQGIYLEFTPEVVKEVARLGYDPSFGARPLRGVISDKIKSVLAEKILKEEIIKGETVKIDFENGQFLFVK